MSPRSALFAFLLLAILSLCACSSGSAPDPDPDGDTPDGDEDGDVPDGDEPDGDEDGDLTDGDIPDGDEDGDEDTDEEFVYPDHAFVHTVRNTYTPVVDTLYQEEMATFFRTTAQLPVLDVRDLALFDQDVFAATADGLYVLRSTASVFTPLLSNDVKGEPIPIALVDIAAHSGDDSVIWAATPDTVWQVARAGGSHQSKEFTDSLITCVEQMGDTLLVGTSLGLFHTPATLLGTWTRLVDTEGWVVNGLSEGPDGMLYAATNNGLMAIDPESGVATPWTYTNEEKPGDNVTRFVGVATCGTKVAALGDNTLFLIDPSSPTTPTIFRAVLDGGLPTGDNLTISCTETAALIGHAAGASHIPFDGSAYDHYGMGRWLPYQEGDPSFLRVPATALASDGTRWLGTAYGISQIDLIDRRLADKEKVHDDMVDNFWRLEGFFASDGQVSDPWADPSTMSLGDKDNDGLWTQMMIGGWCYAFAATGDKRYYDYARKAMDNMFKLIDYPAITFEEMGKPRGFIARSFVREDEGVVYTHKVEQGELVTGKDILRWNPIEVDGVNYLWKADTSSDEIAGHNFGFPVFYDLCAQNDEERAEVARYMGEMIGYIVDGGFKLVDLDGTETLHGHWQPERLAVGLDGLGPCMENGYSLDDCMSSRHGGGWLNSMQILGGLLAAWHVTGETRFYDAYEYLIREHRYDELAMAGPDTYTITLPSIANHSDHELAMLAYTTLIRYEPNDARRERWIESLEFLFGWEKPERNPWWGAICALAGCEDPDLESTLRTLRELPDDRREWAYDLVYRKDHKANGNDRHSRPQIDRVYPYDEIRTMWWNGNPYARTSGGNGREWSAPTTWLLPYYMHLYAGTIVEE